MKKLALAAAAISCLAACETAMTSEDLQQTTARLVGGNVRAGEIGISIIERGVTHAKWDAITPSGNYSCSSDDLAKRASCVKQ